MLEIQSTVYSMFKFSNLHFLAQSTPDYFEKFKGHPCQVLCMVVHLLSYHNPTWQESVDPHILQNILKALW